MSDFNKMSEHLHVCQASNRVAVFVGIDSVFLHHVRTQRVKILYDAFDVGSWKCWDAQTDGMTTTQLLSCSRRRKKQLCKANITYTQFYSVIIAISKKIVNSSELFTSKLLEVKHWTLPKIKRNSCLQRIFISHHRNHCRRGTEASCLPAWTQSTQCCSYQQTTHYAPHLQHLSYTARQLCTWLQLVWHERFLHWQLLQTTW